MQIKPNALAIRAKLKERGNYTIAGHPGLWLAARGDGNGSWRIRYRPYGSKLQKWHTIDNDARNADFDEIVRVKDQWFAKVRHDKVDPKAILDAEAKAKRVADAATALTLDKAVAQWLDRPRKEPLRPRTREEYERIHRLHISPAFGSTPIADLTKQAIREHYEAAAVQAQKRGARKGNGERGLQSAKALKQLCSVLSWCVERDMLDRNPALGIEAPAPNANPNGKKARPLTDAELRAIWTNADAKLSSQHARMLRLALLLGRRVSEIAGAPKSELRIDVAEPHWLIPPREGNKSSLTAYVPLPPLALSIVKEAIEAAGISPWLFPQRGRPDMSATRNGVSQAFTEFRRDIGIEDQVRLHDVRGLIVDQLLTMQVPPTIISHVLHHTGDTQSSLAMSAYRTYEFATEKRRALRLWQLRLRNIVSGRKLHKLRWHV